MHVDEFIEDPFIENSPEQGEVDYAQWMLFNFTLPASLQLRFSKFLIDNKLFCVYNGIKYRCTGASRLGDVWLTQNFKQDTGYQKRVDIAECTKWSRI